jgi:hypothetical protein
MVFWAPKPRRLLLQGRGREGRCGVASPLLALDRQHRELAAGGRLERAHRLARRALVGEAELLHLGAAVLDQFAGEFLLRVHELGVDGPVFLRLERRDLILALADHAQRRALHPAGGQPRPDLLPQQRR